MPRKKTTLSAGFLLDPQADRDLGPNIKARYDLAPSEAVTSPMPDGLDSRLRAALERKGLDRLYSHQSKGLEHLLEGRDLIVSTPTASGKSLIYQIYAIDRWLKDPASRSLFIYPYKALAQDQCAKLREFAARLGFEDFDAAIYDGDTKAAARRKIQKDPPPVVMTNPDMLHLAFLAFSENWDRFFRALGLVVLDETHVYRGIFGANVHHLLWRFGRVLVKEGSSPLWVATSATLSDPRGFFRTLTGREAALVEESGAPKPGRHLYLMSAEGSPYTLACEVMDRLLKEGARTLTFTKARRVTELVYSWLCQRDRSYKKTVSSYRAGFLPAERRKIEKAFFEGELLGVVSTSAMEVGIDVGGLDACILVGYPGSLISLYQRMGRVGRGDKEAAIFLIAMPDALDQYFVQHPEKLLNRPIEEVVLDPENPHIIPSHLLCAAREVPLEDADFGGGDPRRSAIDSLDQAGDLVLDAGGVSWHTLRRNPHREVNLRTMGESYLIVGPSGKAVGSIDGHRVYRECHEGAVYLHQGQTYVVTGLSHKDRKVTVEAENTDYFTEVRGDKETEILEVLESRKIGPSNLHIGKLKVTEYLTSYVKKRMSGGETIAEYPLESPPLVFETEGFWVALPTALGALTSRLGLHLMGGIHAFEHALIGIFPLRALSDRWDLGGISYPHHPQVKGPAVFVYDGYPGGVGLCRKGYELFEDLVETTGRVVRDCECEDGCPACIQSPKCGSGNKPLDKTAAILIAGILEGSEDVPPAGEVGYAAPHVVEEEAPAEARGVPGRLVFDLETQKLASEVGGWGHIRDMRLALAVTWDLDRNAWRTYFEEEAEDLIEDLLASPEVIGFNVDRFDIDVLRPYTQKDLRRVKTLDLLSVLKERLGFRVSLASLAEANFGDAKQADGVQSVQWFREGRFDLIESYCRKDVELTGRLYLKGLEDGYVLIRTKAGEHLRINVLGWGKGQE
jgi:DEAD/DEAH box helicase domain-containing protein